MLESCVSCTRVNIVSGTKLLDLAEPLKLSCVNDLPELRLEADDVMDAVLHIASGALGLIILI